MNRKIIGVTVGTTLPKPDFLQEDPTKGNYIKNKPDFATLKDEVESLSNLVGDTSVSLQISQYIEDSGNKIYKQNDEPIDAPDGTLWVDLDAEGMEGSVSGGSIEGAVLYTEQYLTESQKAQARQNIGAAAVGEGGDSNSGSNVDQYFETVTKSTIDTITWDGNTTDRAVFNSNYYFVSSSVFAIEDFANGCTATTTSGGINYVSSSKIVSVNNGLIEVGNYAYVVNEPFATENGIPVGVYFLYRSSNIYIERLDIPGYELIKSIKDEYLPEHLRFYNLFIESGDTLTWDGNTNGLEVIDGLYKVSNANVVNQILANGFTCLFSNGSGHRTSSEQAQNYFEINNGIYIQGRYRFSDDGIFLMNDGEQWVAKIIIPNYTGFGGQIKINPKYILNNIEGFAPIKGVDYWTEEDQAEIVDAVVARFTNVSEVGA